MNSLSLEKYKKFGSVLYVVQDAVFLIENGGHSDIKQRLKKIPNASKCEKVTSYFIKQEPYDFIGEELKMSAK